MSFQNTFTSDNWHRDARSIAQRNGIRTRRWGMRVTVYLGGSAGDYVLSYGLASTNLQDNNNWLLVANIGATWGGGGVPVNIYTSDGVQTDLDRTYDGNSSNLVFTNFNDFTIFAGTGGGNLVLENSGAGDANLTSVNGAVLIQSGSDIGIQAPGIVETNGLNVLSYADNSELELTVDVRLATGNAMNLIASGINTLQSTGSNVSILASINAGLTADNGDANITSNFGNVNILSDFGGVFTSTNNGDLGFTATIGNIDISALVGNIDFSAFSFTLQGLAAATPATMFFRGDGTWAVPASSGITNTAANTELGMSDGTNIVPSGLFMPVVGQSISFGSASIAGSTRTITAVGSLGAIGITIATKGAGGLILQGGGATQAVFGNSGAAIGISTGSASSSGKINSNAYDLTNRITVETTNATGAVYFAGSTAPNEFGWVGLGPGTFVLAAIGGSPTPDTGKDIEVRAGDGGTPGNGGNVILSPGLAGSGGGVAGYIIANSLPTSSAGLPTGALWNNAGVVNVA